MASRFSIEATFSAVDKITAPVTKMERVTRQLSTGIKRDMMSIGAGFTNMRQSMFGNLLGYDLFKSAVFAAGGAIKYMVTEAQKIEDAQASFTPLVGSVEKATQLVDMLNVAAAETPFRFEDMTKTAKQLLPVMDGDLNRTIDTIKMLGDTAGGNAEKLDSITRGYTKAMLKGKVDMESLNMIAEAGVPIHTELARSMGYGKDRMTEFFKKVSSGTVGTEELNKAFKKMTSEGGIFFQGMIIASKTTSGVLSTMQDSVSMTAAGIGSALLPVVKEIAIEVTKTASKMLEWVNANKGLISDKVREFWESLKSGLSIIGSIIKFMWDYSAVLEWIIKLWVLYKIVSIAAFAHSKLTKIVEWTQAIFTMGTTLDSIIGTTETMTAAQMKLNAAMSANVISLIIIGIAALSYVIYDAIKNWNDYGAAMLAIIPGAGWLVETIMMIKTHWESITNAFSSGGMLEGLKAIGVMLLDFILMPLQQILELASNIPGLGDLANIGADKIKGLRASMGIDVTGGAKSETAKDRNVQTQSQQISQSISKNTSQNITNTQTKEVKIVIDNQNQSNIKLNQAYLNGW
jgi:tape measure domain-containing protein